MPVGDRKRIVKDAGIGEVAHGKAIQPLLRSETLLTVHFVFDANLAGKHFNFSATGKTLSKNDA